MKKSISVRYQVLIILAIVLSTGIHSQPKYKVSDIPKELTTNAKAVVRNAETIFEITGIDKAVERNTYAVTIMNQNGITNSVFYDFYNKFLTIRKVDWAVYDKDGNRIKNLSNVELNDYSAIAGYSLYEDNRVKFIDPNYRATPFTVEYKYEIVYDGLMFYPTWKVYKDYNISVEKATLSIIAPKGFKFRYLQKNMTDSCVRREEDNRSVYTWTTAGKQALREEPFSLSLQEYTPVVYTAPNDFEIDGYKGNLETWKNFGNWINSLNEGRTILGPETTKKIRELVSQTTDEKKKIGLLYRYLQEKVRYVSIQVGLGGWQTIDAQTVDRLSYGDCKALANYMKALLDIAGIRSFYTLVRAGEDAPEMLNGFPSSQFNHAFICIPLANDTAWLECTSQTLPTGFLGKFTDDRNVLLIDKDGGIVVRTKRYSIDDNIQQRKAVVNMSGGGDAGSSVLTSYKGVLYDDIYSVLMMDDADRKKFIQKRIPIKSFDIESMSYSEERLEIPTITEELKLGLPNYLTISGNRLLFNPDLIARFGNLPYRITDRKSIIHIKRPYNQIDTIIYKLPIAYKVEQVPENKSVITKFGEYSTTITYNMEELLYIRSFKFFKGDYPATDYSDFVNFCEKVSILDDRKVSLVKLF